MNKRGFTLVDILAVLVILGLVMIIVATKGFGAFNNTKGKIDELNYKAIDEGIKLLAVEIENCDDELDYELLKMFSTRTNYTCEELKKDLDRGGGITLSLSDLISNGYIEGSSIKKIENDNNYEIKLTYKNNKIVYETSISAKKATLLKRTSSTSTENFYAYASQIVEVKFVNYIDTTNAIEVWDKNEIADTSKTNVDIKAWIEASDLEPTNYVLYIGSENKIYAPSDMSSFFRGFTKVKSFNFGNLNTSEVTNMSSMFTGCSSLTNINLNSFDTSNVEYMTSMFASCTFLVNINLSGFDTSKVKDMSSMFFKCRSLITLDLSSFNTDAVTIMKNMFSFCTMLEKLYINNFNTINANVSGMFNNSKALKSVYAVESNISNITSQITALGATIINPNN